MRKKLSATLARSDAVGAALTAQEATGAPSPIAAPSHDCSLQPVPYHAADVNACSRRPRTADAVWATKVPRPGRADLAAALTACRAGGRLATAATVRVAAAFLWCDALKGGSGAAIHCAALPACAAGRYSGTTNPEAVLDPCSIVSTPSSAAGVSESPACPDALPSAISLSSFSSAAAAFSDGADGVARGR